MKTISSILVAGCLATLGLASDQFHLEDTTNHYSLDARSGAAGMLDSKTKRYPFRLKGNAIAQTLQIQLLAETMQGVLGPNPALGGQVSLLSATATGTVKAIRTVHIGNGLRVSTLTGSSATFSAAGAEGHVVLQSPVSLTDTNPAKKTTLVATGKHGTATLDLRAKAKGSGLLDAKLDQDVRVDIVQSDGKGHLLAFGNTMTLNNRTPSPVLSLSGDVRVSGSKDSSFGSAKFQRFTMHLNDRGEVSSWDGSSGTP
jgi:hypothetical protein